MGRNMKYTHDIKNVSQNAEVRHKNAVIKLECLNEPDGFI